MTDDLIAFVRARLDDDEQTARRAAARQPEGGVWTYDQPALRTGSGLHIARRMVPVHGAHIARHDPKRVLAEVAAKRRVLARHCAAPVPPGNEWAKAYPYCVAHAYKEPDGTVIYPVELKNCPELRDLAAPYADHPDYREEWRP